ncbi:MAG: hydrogenase expression/formation protein HypE [Anaerolineaceae bacterium]
MTIPVTFESPVCPLPDKHDDEIVIGHGSGGRMTQQLIEKVFMPRLSSQALLEGNDFGTLELPSESGLKGRLVFSTDAHIVSPLFFNGGDIGRLSICGTVNDIAVSGAKPLYLSASFILEEGFPIALLEKILNSMQIAAKEAGIEIAAADTKVVEKDKGDGIFISTTGLGWLPEDLHIGGESARPGDHVLVSGTLGDHAIAVLTARGDMGFEADISSDVAPLNHLIQALLRAAPHTHVLRDPTRGGLATTLNEIAHQSRVGVLIDQNKIPVKPEVQSVCDMLGFDPLYLANEGKVIVIVPPQESEKALSAMRSLPYGSEAALIGEVQSEPSDRVLMKTLIGGTRILDTLSGEILPRIC